MIFPRLSEAGAGRRGHRCHRTDDPSQHQGGMVDLCGFFWTFFSKSSMVYWCWLGMVYWEVIWTHWLTLGKWYFETVEAYSMLVKQRHKPPIYGLIVYTRKIAKWGIGYYCLSNISILFSDSISTIKVSNERQWHRHHGRPPQYFPVEFGMVFILL